MTVSFKPEGYHTATSYLIVNDPQAAIEFYRQAFGAAELFRLTLPEGEICHAEFRIGDSTFMIGKADKDQGARCPIELGGTPIHTMLYVEDVDAVFATAVDAGGKQTRPVTDQFYGDRSGTLVDPFGHQWTIATHIEDVDLAEAQARFDAMLAQG